jgi:hypothetical protein
MMGLNVVSIKKKRKMNEINKSNNKKKIPIIFLHWHFVNLNLTLKMGLHIKGRSEDRIFRQEGKT